MDDVGDSEELGLQRRARLLVELADCGLREGFARLALADGEVPHALGELGVLAALEEDDTVGGLVVDDDGRDQQGHGFQGRFEGLRLAVGLLGHGGSLHRTARRACEGDGLGRTGLRGLPPRL
ncbi:hypothetical protein ADK34_19935 [Streptomyces viridochromogenes]|uniref:Uncharacterized protein n=1 Tax=Streptomyces viridochromogenes TaxID=1938 RepID=A0A0L8KCN5_STRVR|nr:hypothetical protein ADK34_19935 [Streptomyces viridochromogenes]